jgi:hypothetical protein
MFEHLVVASAFAVSVASPSIYLLAPKGAQKPAYEVTFEIDAHAKNYDNYCEYIEENYSLKEFSDLLIKESRDFNKEEAEGYRQFLEEIFS